MSSSGLKQNDGVINEEILRQLEDADKRTNTYKSMATDYTVGAILFVVEMLIRGVDWSVQAASEDQADIENKEFLESCLDDMSSSWNDTIAEILSFLTYGYSFHEIVYKFRQGDTDDPSTRSKHNDGRIGWRKLSGRSQDSLARWIIGDDGGVDAFVQNHPTTYGTIEIPIEKGLLFRASSYKNNPEGKSILRNAYSAWYYKSRIQTIEAIGIERDLAGFPVMTVPPEWTDSNGTSAHKAAYAEAKKIVTRIKRDEQEGIVLPAYFDENGNQLIKLELLTSGGRRQFDTSDIISRYDQSIARTVLADFMFLGSQSVGSYALSSDKTALFATAVGAWVDMIASVFNRHAIPRLFKLNGLPLDSLPQLVPGDLEKPDIERLGTYVKTLTEAGVNIGGVEVANVLLDAAGLPLLPEEEEIPDETEGMFSKPVDETDEVLKSTRELLDGIRESMGD